VTIWIVVGDKYSCERSAPVVGFPIAFVMLALSNVFGSVRICVECMCVLGKHAIEESLLSDEPMTVSRTKHGRLVHREQQSLFAWLLPHLTLRTIIIFCIVVASSYIENNNHCLHSCYNCGSSCIDWVIAVLQHFNDGLCV
jgi:hypothetical protein